MKNPITIIKIGDQHYKPTSADLDNWRKVFEGELSEAEMSKKYPHMVSQPIEKKEFDIGMNANYNRVLIVSIGDEFTPTADNIEYWRDMFVMAVKDKDFKIFTSSKIEIRELKIGNSSKILVE